MPISREKKETIVADLKAEFAGARGALFTDFRGVDVAGITELRAKLRGRGARYLVAKRTLAERALAAAPAAQLRALLDGATAIAFVPGEPVEVAKVLVDFKKDYERFVVKGGWVDGEFFDAEKIIRLAKTPPRDVLLSTLLGVMKSPPASLAGVARGVLRKAVATLAAIADRKRAEEGGPPA